MNVDAPENRESTKRLPRLLLWGLILACLLYPYYLVRRENLGQEMMDATWKGDTPRVERLLRWGADVNVRYYRKDRFIAFLSGSSDGVTPLTVGCIQNNPSIVKVLLKRGAEVNSMTWMGTPLGRAVETGNPEIVRLLLRHGANVNANNGVLGYKPLLIAAGARRTRPPDEDRSVEIATLLLDGGAEINARGRQGETALMGAAMSGRAKMIKLLLARRADVHATDSEGHTAMKYAVECGDENSLALLEKAGTTITFRDAVAMGDVAAARRFPVKAAELDREYELRTMLMTASEQGRLDVVRLLIEKGADVNARIEARTTPLHEAASNDHLEIVRLLLDKGARVNETDTNGCTALSVAASGGHIEIVRLLLRRGADVNTKANSNLGWTPLMWATFYGDYTPQAGHNQTVLALLAAGADPNVTDEQGETALMWAARDGNAITVKALLGKGADAKAKSKEGMTALRYAGDYHKAAVIGLLEGVRAK